MNIFWPVGTDWVLSFVDVNTVYKGIRLPRGRKVSAGDMGMQKVPKFSGCAWHEFFTPYVFGKKNNSISMLHVDV